VGIANAERILNNPRAPRQRKATQNRIRGLKSTEPEAAISFDMDFKSDLLTEFYTDLFKASEVQSALPQWVRLEDQFNERDLEGMPRIDGLLLRKAINLFANNKSCADDGVVAEMLSVLSEDVLETLAEAFINRVLNREGREPNDHTHDNKSSRFVEYPEVNPADKLDDHKRKHQETGGEHGR